MDIYKYINRFIIYPLYYFKSGDKRLERLREIEKQQYWSSGALKASQFEQSKSIIQYAYKHTRYYRKLLDDIGLHPNDIQTFKDIEKIPPLTKSDIQTYGSDLLSDEFDKASLMQDASGGSTGEPTKFFKTLSYHQMRAADQLRHDQWSGWRLGDRFALIWGAQRDLKASQSFREFIISRYIARIWELDAFEMTPEKMTSYVKTLERIQPSMVLGYANALVAFSEFLLKAFPNHNIRPKGIISSAETLTEDKRIIIEKAFKCKVLNRYGSREVGLIASECQEQSGLHINANSLLVEVTNNGSEVAQGESGDILVTDFNNKAMPLIRYKLGDVGKQTHSTCKCGRGLPLMKSVEGRSGDFFVADNETLVHGEYFTHLFYGVDDVKKFQMIQHEDRSITLKIVSVSKDSDAAYIHVFKQKVAETIGTNHSLDIEFVDEIPPTVSGKLLFTISKVAR